MKIAREKPRKGNASGRLPRGALVALMSVTAVAAFVSAYVFLQGSLSGALREKQESISRPSGDEEASALLSRAASQMDAGEYARAERLVRDALVLAPENPEAYNLLGLALKNQGRPEEAVSAYRRAVELDPGFSAAMNNLAVALESLDGKFEAEALYRKILLAEPASAEVHLNYALLLEGENRLFEAESHFHTFMNLSRDEELKGRVRKRLMGLR